MILRLLLLVIGVTVAQPAVAQSCDAANRFSFSFSDQQAATLAYGTSYNYTAANGAGTTSTFSMRATQNGLSNTQVAGLQMPAIGTLITGSDATKRDLIVGGIFSSRTADIFSSTRVITTTFSFAMPVREIAFTVHDIDYAVNQFRDWFAVTGSNGAAAYTGTLSLGPTAISAVLGPTSVPVSAAAGTAVGTASAGNNSEQGTIIASFAQPVTSVALRYGNYPLQSGETVTGQQAMGIAGFSFCPMPSITITKTSAPATDSLGAFNIPDNDVIYTLTVTNSGGSTVDAGTIVLTDTLPAGITFKNIAFDGTTTLPVKLSGTAGVTLNGSNVTYRQAGSASFGYTPFAGYDPQVAEIRVNPGGTMAANSSFTIQFKSKIN